MKVTAQSQVKTVFSRVFTPVNLAEKTRQVESSPSSSSADTASDDSEHEDVPEVKNAPPPTMSVFSRPPTSQVMQVFEDKEDKDVFGSNPSATKPTSIPQTHVRTEPVFRRKSIATGRQAFIPHNRQAFSSSGPLNAFSQPIDIDDSDESVSHPEEDDADYDDPEVNNQECNQDDDEEGPSYQAPMGAGSADSMS